MALSQQMFAQWRDDFSDGNFFDNPTWLGETTDFTIEANELRIFAPAVAGQSYLAVASESIQDARWEFTVRMNFNPSSSNYARVYVVSSQEVLTDTLQGYFVMIGNTADEISLYRQTGSTRTKIIDGVDGRVNASVVTVRIRVTREASGLWQLYSDVGLTGTFQLEGTVVDGEHVSSNYFGVFCNYTSTRSDKFYFDDFVVSGAAYVPPPPPQSKDIIISEIFADPSPRVELPDYEFVELYNRSSSTYNLAGWTLSDGSSQTTFPSIDLQPNEYLIVTSTSAYSDFSVYGKTIGVGGFPSLNNSGDPLMLMYRTGTLVDSIHYSSTWYRNDVKEGGGWSLEIIDPENTCSEETNWTASDAVEGGTPGKQNSVFASNPDLTGPKLVRAIPLSETELKLVFNEKLATELPSILDFRIEPAATIRAVHFADHSLRELSLTLDSPLQEKVLHTLIANSVYDCAGNGIQFDFNRSEFALPEDADSLDVVINEILFNPKPTGVDFIEVYNRSDKYINLKGWSVANYESDQVENSSVLFHDDFLIFPNTYLVVTEDKDVLLGEYPQTKAETVLEVGSLPALNDDEGSVLLISETGRQIDFLKYSKSYHSIFIRDDEGVSLERISPSRPTNEPENWKSASSASGFATPGFLNSNSRPEKTIAENTIEVQPEVFVPINGLPDFTEIHYHFDQGGWVANVKIYDANGHLIKQLANNELLGTEGLFRWEGDCEDGSKARIGSYMVWFEVFDSRGEVNTFRKRLAIAGRF